MLGIFAEAKSRVSCILSLGPVLVIFKEEVKYDQRDSGFSALHSVSTCVCFALAWHYSLGTVTVMLPVLYMLISMTSSVGAKRHLCCLY